MALSVNNLSFQELMKIDANRYDNIYSYLKKYLCENNIAAVSGLLNSIEPKTETPYKKDVFDSVVFLLCNERITLSQAKDLLYNYESLDDSDELKFLLSSYFSPQVELLSGKTKIIKNTKKAIDYIPRIYYGRNDIESYRDLNNIRDEYVRIISMYNDSDDFSTEEKIKEFVNYYVIPICRINNFSETGIDIDSNTYSPIDNYIPAINYYLNNAPEYDINDCAKMFGFERANIDQYLDTYFWYISDNNIAKKLAKFLPIIVERTIHYKID